MKLIPVLVAITAWNQVGATDLTHGVRGSQQGSISRRGLQTGSEDNGQVISNNKTAKSSKDGSSMSYSKAAKSSKDGGSMSYSKSSKSKSSKSATVAPTTTPSTSTTLSPTMSTNAPSQSPGPTLTNCDNPGTCENRLRDIIYAVSIRVGTTDLLDDPLSPQSLAADWILEECDATIPIDPCTESQIILNEQRYALAVMYFSLSGDGWNAGANPGVDKGAGAGTWLSGLNYCEWGVEISSETGGSYNQLVCDEFGNVLNLNLREYLHLMLSGDLLWLTMTLQKD